MIRRVVLDRAPGGLAARLADLGSSPAVERRGHGPGTLFVTESADRARSAVDQGSKAWVVGAVGELASWDDLPLALALGHGTLTEVRSLVDERLRARGVSLSKLGWSPDGSAVGEADGQPVLVTAGPDGEDPQVFLGEEARSMARERGVFLDTLRANDAVATQDDLGPGQTHTLDAPDARRPRLERKRFSYTGESL